MKNKIDRTIEDVTHRLTYVHLIKYKNKTMSDSAITLVALVITIIILLILAAVSISVVMGDSRNI